LVARHYAVPPGTQSLYLRTRSLLI
jgi:hypothetical protein